MISFQAAIISTRTLESDTLQIVVLVESEQRLIAPALSLIFRKNPAPWVMRLKFRPQSLLSFVRLGIARQHQLLSILAELGVQADSTGRIGERDQAWLFHILHKGVSGIATRRVAISTT